MNPQQIQAVTEWQAGKNVKVTAVPGAGKSRCLIETCKTYSEGLIIILAYNHDLCEETKQKLVDEQLDDRVICMTFHGLATYCIGPCYDDTALFDAIEGVEGGEIEVQKQICVSAVLIDEAQDFRPSFLRLLGLVLELGPDVQYMVVGDPYQMLYTYDEEDPADIKYLTEPWVYFASTREWVHVEFFKTHRITPPMARLVSSMYNINVVSAKTEEKQYPVYVHSINLWKAGPIVMQLIQNVKHHNVCVLAPKKKNNGPLRATLNFLSAHGIRIYLHGFDGQDSRIRDKKLCVSTWHASKGTEKNIVIVLGLNNEVEQNPCFVALTRAKLCLVIIQDEDHPYTVLMKALQNGNETVQSSDVSLCPQTRKMLSSGFKLRPKSDFAIENAVAYSLDHLRPKGTARWMRDFQNVECICPGSAEEEEDDVIRNHDMHEDVSDIYAYACCMRVEYEKTGRVRLLDDIRAPHRIPRNKQDEAILGGHHSRFVAPNIPVNSLLGEDMAQILTAYAHGQRISSRQWCELACVARSWNDYHHTCRQLRPFHWFDCDKFEKGCTLLGNIFEEQDAQFDVRVKAQSNKYPNVCLHARVHATSEQGIFYFVWSAEISHFHRICASIRAALNAPQSVAFVVNIRSGQVQKITVSQPETVLSQLL